MMALKTGLYRYGVLIALVQGVVLSGCAENAPDTRTASRTETVARPTPPTPAPAPVAGPERLVLAFGDSLYAGYGLDPGQSLPDAVQARLRDEGINATLINAGVSGDTTAAGRQRLAFTLDNLARKPDLVLLGLGGNDVLRQLPPAETRANMIAMLDELRRRDIPVLLTGMLAPPNLGPEFGAAFNRIWPDLARDYGAGFDPFILAGVAGDRTAMLPDNVHPNVTGVARIADRIAPLVETMLAADTGR